jgi:ubiquinone/menaquinone biosynthesis C-methylase UbiE
MTMARENPARFYDESYRRASAEGDLHARWRQLSARGKADHAIELCARAGLRPARIAEIGCGDGALLAELGARGLAGELHGFEVSEEAARIARGRGTPGLAAVTVYDGERLPAADGSFDVAILSHVLEHVTEPAALLREAARVARAVVLEVPLEANLSASRAAKREGAAEIGHLQALDRPAVRSLVESAGMSVRAELLDPLPLEVHTFFAPAGAPRARATAKAAVRRGLFTLSPGLAERAFTLHYACLAVR